MPVQNRTQESLECCFHADGGYSQAIIARLTGSKDLEPHRIQETEDASVNLKPSGMGLVAPAMDERHGKVDWLGAISFEYQI